MKIAICLLDDISKDHGATVRAKRVYEVLSWHFEVNIVSWSTENLKTKQNVVLIKVPNKRPIIQLPFWLFGQIISLIRNKYDLIYSCTDWYGFIIYYLYSKIYSVPLIFEAHGILSEEYLEYSNPGSKMGLINKIGFNLRRSLERFVVRRSNTLIALSCGISDFYGKYNDNTILIPVFIDTNKFRLDTSKRGKFREEYGLSESKVVGVIGPFYSTFNKHYLEFIYDNIDKFDKRIKFMLIGPGVSKKEHNRLIYTGFVEDYAGVLSCLDAVVVPSNVSTSGPLNKIVETMSCSLPVFTTPKGLIGLDYAENGKNIFVVEENELIEKINNCIFNDNLLRIIGANAAKTAEKYYGNVVNEKKLLGAIHSK